MTSKGSRAVDVYSITPKRKWSMVEPPMLRIVLLGKSVAENSHVGNFILGRAAFESEADPADVEQHSERVRGKHITIVNSPHLLQPNLSLHQLTERVRECVYLSAPGPHMIVLVLKNDEFTREEREYVEMVLKSFSDSVFEHTMVLTTAELHSVKLAEVNEDIKEIIKACCNRHYNLEKSSTPADVLQKFKEIVKENIGNYLICSEHEDSLSFTTEKHATGRVSEGVHSSSKLNLVLCGSDKTLKASISNLIFNQRERRSESSSECVRREGEACGRLINLVELPALSDTHLSEEEMMREIFHCVFLCNPGVHVFLLIIPDGPLTDEDRGESEKIQRIFSTGINKHTLVLTIQSSVYRTEELNETTKSVIDCFGGRHHFFDLNTPVSILMEKVIQMVDANNGDCFSTELFLDAQMNKILKYEEINRKINSQKMGILLEDLHENTDDVRIVLLGKTGVGKSATGNTILGRTFFKAEQSFESVTNECQKETTIINERNITVIDTPGLFDTEYSNEEIQREITNCISMILPGPHVFLLLVSLGRFTQEEAKSVKIIQETFGENSLRYTMVLFTRGDDLKDKNIEQVLGKPGSVIRKLTDQCGNRYHVLNNNQTEDRTQVSVLLDKIDAMVAANGGSYYTCKMFRQMERALQEEKEKIMMERVEQVSREKEELLIKHESEIERMKMMMEGKRQNHDEESRKREEEFKEKEEKYKIEIKKKEEHERQMLDEIKKERETLKHEIEKIRREKREDEDRKRTTFREREEQYKMKMKKEQNVWETQKQNEKRTSEDKTRMEKEDEIWNEYNQRLNQERARMKREKEELQYRHELEIERLKMMIEEQRRNEKKVRERIEKEFRETEEPKQNILKETIKQMKKEKKEFESEIETMKMNMEEERQNQYKERRKLEEEFGQKEEFKENLLKETVKQLNKEKEELVNEHELAIERLKMIMEEESRNQYKERRKLEAEFREREEYKDNILNETIKEMNKEKRELVNNHELAIERMKMIMEEERHNQYRETRKLEAEFREREERYKSDITNMEKQLRKMNYDVWK